MRNCGECDGPLAKCPYCRHVHCDDDECRAMPIECAREGQE